MIGICIRYMKNESEAKDILQEGFIKVFSKIKQFKGKGSLEGWIKRIMINTAINYYHKNKKQKQYRDLDEINEIQILDFDNQQPEIIENSVYPSEINEYSDDLELIVKADFSKEELLESLDTIPESFKLVFNLYFIEHFQHKEIAKMLKIDVNTSRTRLLRARKLLQKHLYQRSLKKLKIDN